MTQPDPRLSMNQATIKYASLADAIEVTAEAGVQAIGLWREPVAEVGLPQAARLLSASGLRLSTYCRGGFFTVPDGEERRLAMADNRCAIEETATLAAAGAPGSQAVLVLVVGGLPAGSRDLPGARQRVVDALNELAPVAQAAGVTLAIEPLHPMYCSDRAVVSTLAQALDMTAGFPPEVVGVTVDTFHIWWDPQVLDGIARAGREKRLATYQVCDWKTPLAADVLLSRHYPGDGVIDFGPLTSAVLQTGYDRDIEVEIFNAEVWADAPRNVVKRTVAAFASTISPHARHPAEGRTSYPD